MQATNVESPFSPQPKSTPSRPATRSPRSPASFWQYRRLHENLRSQQRQAIRPQQNSGRPGTDHSRLKGEHDCGAEAPKHLGGFLRRVRQARIVSSHAARAASGLICRRLPRHTMRGSPAKSTHTPSRSHRCQMALAIWPVSTDQSNLIDSVKALSHVSILEPLKPRCSFYHKHGLLRHLQDFSGLQPALSATAFHPATTHFCLSSRSRNSRETR